MPDINAIARRQESSMCDPVSAPQRTNLHKHMNGHTGNAEISSWIPILGSAHPAISLYIQLRSSRWGHVIVLCAGCARRLLPGLHEVMSAIRNVGAEAIL